MSIENPAPVPASTISTSTSLKDRGNLFEIATSQVERAMKLIQLDPDVAEIPDLG